MCWSRRSHQLPPALTIAFFSSRSEIDAASRDLSSEPASVSNERNTTEESKPFLLDETTKQQSHVRNNNRFAFVGHVEF